MGEPVFAAEGAAGEGCWVGFWPFISWAMDVSRSASVGCVGCGGCAGCCAGCAWSCVTFDAGAGSLGVALTCWVG